MTDTLAHRAIQGFGHMFTVFGGALEGPEAIIHRPDLIGVSLRHPDIHPFFNSAVVPLDATPPQDHPDLPHYLWTVASQVRGRVEEPESAIPCMGMALDGLNPSMVDRKLNIDTPSLGTLGALNERVYGEEGFRPLAEAVRDHRVRRHGVRHGDAFVSVAMTLKVGDDLGIHYVATDEAHRRQGLATKLIAAVMHQAREEGMRTATLQASDMGMPIWRRLGFQHVARLRAYVRA